MYKVIGISGKAGVGKDTLATMLSARLQDLGFEYQRYAFALPLKRATEFLFGWTLEQIEDREFKEKVDPAWGFTPRRAMQLLGTEFGRELKSDLWLQFAQKKCDEALSQGFSGLMVTDCRFENEAEWVRNNGGLVVHVVRGDEVQLPWYKKWFSRAGKVHASEGGVKKLKGDYTIKNDGSLLDLSKNVLHLANWITSN